MRVESDTFFYTSTRMFASLLLLFLLLPVPVIGEQRTNPGKKDFCADRIPKDLQALILARFKTQRLPRSSEWRQEAIGYNEEKGGTGCLGITAGDFDGNRMQDFAALLAPRKPDGPTLLIAARRIKGGSWMIEELRNWGTVPGSSLIGGLYVETLPPGDYEMFGGLDSPPSEPGEVEKFHSQFAGIVSGGIEKSGVAYFFDGQRWVHVWVSD